MISVSLPWRRWRLSKSHKGFTITRRGVTTPLHPKAVSPSDTQVVSKAKQSAQRAQPPPFPLCIIPIHRDSKCFRGFVHWGIRWNLQHGKRLGVLRGVFAAVAVPTPFFLDVSVFSLLRGSTRLRSHRIVQLVVLISTNVVCLLGLLHLLPTPGELPGEGERQPERTESDRDYLNLLVETSVTNTDQQVRHYFTRPPFLMVLRTAKSTCA